MIGARLSSIPPGAQRRPAAASVWAAITTSARARSSKVDLDGIVKARDLDVRVDQGEKEARRDARAAERPGSQYAMRTRK
ncbi:hypothetical protein [Sorangium sp. So ce590]|uniref:hypothetical protein n=1 Tax=unclassified Sorangium TaxID=2621164 RepID=UPI003F5E0D9F